MMGEFKDCNWLQHIYGWNRMLSNRSWIFIFSCSKYYLFAFKSWGLL